MLALLKSLFTLCGLNLGQFKPLKCDYYGTLILVSI